MKFYLEISLRILNICALHVGNYLRDVFIYTKNDITCLYSYNIENVLSVYQQLCDRDTHMCLLILFCFFLGHAVFIIPPGIRQNHVAKFCDSENILHDIVMMEIYHYTSVQTHRMYNTSNELKGYYGLLVIHVSSSLVRKKKKKDYSGE